MQNQGLGLLVSAVLCVLGFYPPLAAADPNGYTSEYECRAGGPKCNIDVAALSAQPCNQVIEPGTPWDSINWNNNVICLRAGDHSAKGRLDLGSSGTSGVRKVLRCVTASGGQCPDPKPGESVTAKIHALDTNSANFWIIDRLNVDGDAQSLFYAVHISGADTGKSNDIVFSRMWVHDHRQYGFEQCCGGLSEEASQRIHIQNSIVHDLLTFTLNAEAECIDGNLQNSYIVNNELYDCNKPIAVGSGIESVKGTVVENNDLYALRTTDCNGNFVENGNCSLIEALMSIKAGGTADLPYRFIHNRLFGGRPGDATLLGGDNSGFAGCASLSASDVARSHYVLFQDNICVDSPAGILGFWGADNNQSVVGNIIYKIHHWPGQSGDVSSVGLGATNKRSTEQYLNTVIDADYWFITYGSPGGSNGEPTGNNDFRCNVAILSGDKHADTSPAPDDVIDNNVFYQTPSYTANGTDSNLSNGVSTRQNNTTYPQDTILRTSSNLSDCTSVNDSACFLYKVVTAGTSGSSNPGYCTTPGCTTTDGGMTVQPIRGPYTFYRKLKTAPEPAIIPYAVTYNGAPEAAFCSNAGGRSGIGINDDPMGQGILDKDLKGVDRVATAGALQASAGTGLGGGGGGGGGTQSPYPGPNAAVIPGKIEVENYDQGGEGIAYHDTSPTNEPGAYRTDAVDVEVTQDAGGGHDVGWITPGEWLEYTVNVATAGTYDIEIRSAAQGPGGTMHIEFNGVDKTGAIVLPDTGNWQAWQTTTKTGVSLSAGQQVMRLAFDVGNNGWLANINYVRVTQAVSNPIGTPYPGPNSAAIPGTIELENYDQGGEGVAYHDLSPTNEPGAYRNDAVDVEVTADATGGYDVGWIQPGEWLTYSVNVETAGTYDIEVRSAAQGPGGTMHIEFNGADKTGAIVLPDTGDWQTWTTVTKTGVTLNAGQQLMKLVFDTGNDGWLANINYVRFIQR